MKKNAFTLVEILVAMAVLSVFIVFAYKIYSYANENYVINIWRSEQSQKLMLVLKKLKYLLEKSSYPAELSLDGAFIESGCGSDYDSLGTVKPNKKYLIQFKPDPSSKEVITAGPATGTKKDILINGSKLVKYNPTDNSEINLIKWWVCTPKIKDPKGVVQQKSTRTAYTLIYKKGKLLLKTYDEKKKTSKVTPLLKDVEQVLISYKAIFPPEGFKKEDLDQPGNGEKDGFFWWEIKGIVTIRIKLTFNLKVHKKRKFSIEEEQKAKVNTYVEFSSPSF